MDKIIIRWTTGRSKRSAIKSKVIAVGKKMLVLWGKAKKACNAPLKIS